MGRKRREDGAQQASKRTRTTPRWLMKRQDLDEVARRRCLMVLSVLSGEQSVTEAIASGDISRQMYFDLEKRALAGMLVALVPGNEAETSSRLEELERKVVELERGKRRAEKLLELTRKVVKPGTMKVGAGRPRGSRVRRRSTKPGASPSSNSTTKTPSVTSAPPSTPTPDGADGR